MMVSLNVNLEDALKNLTFLNFVKQGSYFSQQEREEAERLIDLLGEEIARQCTGDEIAEASLNGMNKKVNGSGNPG